MPGTARASQLCAVAAKGYVTCWPSRRTGLAAHSWCARFATKLNFIAGIARRVTQVNGTEGGALDLGWTPQSLYVAFGVVFAVADPIIEQFNRLVDRAGLPPPDQRGSRYLTVP